jgi:hypothetical protein
MLRKKTGRLGFGLSIALLAMFETGAAQTTCQGYMARAIFGDACMWGCGATTVYNCTVGACADGTTVAIKRPTG